jgi:hypothetical protein
MLPREATGGDSLNYARKKIIKCDSDSGENISNLLNSMLLSSADFSTRSKIAGPYSRQR